MKLFSLLSANPTYLSLWLLFVAWRVNVNVNVKVDGFPIVSSRAPTLQHHVQYAPSSSITRSLACASSKNQYPYESDDDMKRRMEMVRSLQETYYKSENGNVPTLDPSTGIMHHLPLWRVSWTELPGRSNVLNVHEPTYTDMFETILNRPKPWYFGHLYLPGGSKSLRSGETPYQLRSWQDYNRNDDDLEMSLEPNSRAAVVGALMKIVDFRRLEDGRLCLFVHAMERFVIHHALQNLPYSIAHVQILPDYEELANIDTLEEQAAVDRARAVLEAFRYHPYEYKETPLPLSRDKYMSLGDVYGSWLSDLLPFASYHLDTALLMSEPDIEATTSTTNNLNVPESVGDELSMETRLLNEAILQAPSFGGNGS
jgi:Lon protease-like protein